jgi:hypothetical protein
MFYKVPEEVAKKEIGEEEEPEEEQPEEKAHRINFTMNCLIM